MLVIDKMLEIFGPNGEHWIQGFEYRPGRKWCLVGALKSARRRLRSRDDDAGAFIVYALWHVDSTVIKRRMSLEDWNDQKDRTFDEIRDMLSFARTVAGWQRGSFLVGAQPAFCILLDAPLMKETVTPIPVM